MAILKLSKPFLFDGKELKEIEYDLESVSPRMFKIILNRLGKQGIVVAVPELDPNFQEELFSRASGIPVTELDKLTLRDFNAACAAVRGFFMSDSDDTMEESFD